MAAETAMRIVGDEPRKALARRFGFNVTSLAAVKVPEGKDRVWAYDTRVPKLAYMLTATGASSFYWVCKMDGRVVRYRLGDGTMPIEQARKLAMAAQGKAVQGVNPQIERQTARAEQTFGAVWQWYFDNHVKGRLRTADELQGKYDQHLKRWAARRFNSITRSDVARLHQQIGQEHPVGQEHPGSANRLIRLLSSLYNRARDIGFSGNNPAAGIHLFPEHKRERYLLPDELPRFFRALEQVGQDWRDLFEVALYTGARMGNVRGMAWTELHLDSKTWTIPAEKFKTGKPLTIPLVEQAVAILERRRQSHGDSVYVFPATDSDSGHIERPEKAWAKVCAAAKLEGLRMHDLRHSLASWQAGLGISLSTIGRSLGHATAATTARYAHVALDPVRVAVAGAVDAMVKAGKKR